MHKWINKEVIKMDAQEMFEELDFLRTANNDYFISFNKEEEKNNMRIEFEIVFDKLIRVVYFNHYVCDCECNFHCDVKLLKAINKQLEELGW